MSAGDIRTSRVKVNANEASNQQLTSKRTVEGPILDQRLAVAEIQLGAITMNHSLAILLIFALAGCGPRKDALPSSSRDVELSASAEATRQWRHELALVGYANTNESLQALLHNVEQSSFEDAYRLWRQEMKALATSRNSDGGYSIPGAASRTPRPARPFQVDSRRYSVALAKRHICTSPSF